MISDLRDLNSKNNRLRDELKDGSKRELKKARCIEWNKGEIEELHRELEQCKWRAQEKETRCALAIEKPRE